MKTDAELMRGYAVEGSEAAFHGLVDRHINLVHSTALRFLTETHLASDVTQTVFLDLARKAPRLLQHTSLSGWLYSSVRFIALDAVRVEQRRRAREEKSLVMDSSSVSDAPEPAWERIRAILDEAMHDLSSRDRHAVILRFFENKPFTEIGAALDVSENTARMCVVRALQKLRKSLASRGVTTTEAALSEAISGYAIQAAPAALAGTVVSYCTANATAAVTFTTLKLIQATLMTKGKAALIGTVVIAVVGIPLVLQMQANHKLRTENRVLALDRQLTVELQQENARMSNTLARMQQAGDSSGRRLSELMRLRAEITRLRTVQPPATQNVALAKQKLPIQKAQWSLGEFLATATWADVGYGTPEATVQTVSWARATGKGDRVISSIIKPEDAIFPSNEDIEKLSASNIKQYEKTIGMTLDAIEKASDDEVTLLLTYQRECDACPSGITGAPDLVTLRRQGNEWKIVPGGQPVLAAPTVKAEPPIPSGEQ